MKKAGICAATLLVVAVVAWPAAGGSARTIHYYEDLAPKTSGYVVLKKTILQMGHATKAGGDSVIFSNPLRAARGGRLIGRNYATCTTSGFGRDFCHGALVLAGRGTIVYDGLAPSTGGAHVRTIPIVGGTGEFAGVEGFIQSAKQSDSGPGIDWTINLVRG